MAQETLEQLRAELESLRRENQLLRVSARQQKYSPHLELPESVRYTNLLPTFQSQLRHLKQANQQLAAATSLFSELQRSFETLIPALELQITGWTNEIHQQQQAQLDLEQAYASVVGRLEERIKALQQQVAAASPEALQQQLSHLQKDRERMRRRIAELESICQRDEARRDEPIEQNSSSDDSDDPFTDLNIFEP
jgi:chromosome segregation ATPase